MLQLTNNVNFIGNNNQMINKRKKNKKAEIDFLGEHVLGIIISVLCIIVLLFIAVVVCNLFSQKSDLDKAISNFNLVQGEIQLIKTSNGINSGQIIVYFPIGYVLRSYSNGFPKTECYGSKSCLCICEAASCEGVQKSCNGFPFEVEINTSYTASKSWYNPGKYITNPDLITNAIGFTKAAEGLRIYKEDDKIIIEQVQTNK